MTIKQNSSKAIRKEMGKIMYVTVFDKEGGGKLFDLLQDALAKGLKAMSYVDVELILDIKRKIIEVSTKDADYCSWCGHVMKMPTGVDSFFRKLNLEDVLYVKILWTSSEIAKIREALEAYPKTYSQIEECFQLATMFKDAEREEL